jgi:periplasmic copper chaperone A
MPPGIEGGEALFFLSHGTSRMKRDLAERLIVLMLSLGAVGDALAAVTVNEAWVRATVPGQSVAAGYMKLRSGEPATLVGIRTPLAPEAEVHEMSMQGGVMKMRPVNRLALPAGRVVELKPGGYHLMLMNVTKPLKAGDKVPLTLIIERQDKSREDVEVEAEVRGASMHEHRH